MSCAILLHPLYAVLIQALSSLVECEPKNPQQLLLKAQTFDYGVEIAAEIAAKKYGVVNAIKIAGCEK